MVIKNSPLSLENIYIVASNVVAIPRDDNYSGEINDFEIDINFDVYLEKENSNNFKIFLEINGNDQEEPVPGYLYNVTAEGNFQLAEDTPEESKDLYITTSAIPIVIGQIRSYLSTLTSLGPYGMYLMPTIDMADLLNQKGNCTEE